MRNDTQFEAFKPNITFQMFFQVWEGKDQKKIKQKKTKRYVLLIEQFLQQT